MRHPRSKRCSRHEVLWQPGGPPCMRGGRPRRRCAPSMSWRIGGLQETYALLRKNRPMANKSPGGQKPAKDFRPPALRGLHRWKEVRLEPVEYGAEDEVHEHVQARQGHGIGKPLRRHHEVVDFDETATQQGAACTQAQHGAFQRPTSSRNYWQVGQINMFFDLTQNRRTDRLRTSDRGKMVQSKPLRRCNETKAQLVGLVVLVDAVAWRCGSSSVFFCPQSSSAELDRSPNRAQRLAAHTSMQHISLACQVQKTRHNTFLHSLNGSS